MKIQAPSYFEKFRCIADRCRHSCCVGWEIDIDGESLERYLSEQGSFGEKLRSCIDRENSSFLLTEDERCPFLNEKNLCGIIIEKGESALCSICTEHPRFYNGYDGVTEAGLGMCCEEAARLILSSDEDYHADGEIFEERNKLIERIKDESRSLEEIFGQLLEEAGIGLEPDAAKWSEFYGELECLDVEWKSRLSAVSRRNRLILGENGENSRKLRNLTCYFVYRWLLSDYCDNCLTGYTPDEITGFIILSVYMISSACENGGELEDVCRMYSSETEYSDENPIKITEEILKSNN